MEWILDEPLNSPDDQLTHLVREAVLAYRDPRNDRRIEAARTMCQAYEHLKSLEDPKKMDRSVQLLLDKIVSTPDDRELINGLWTALTTAGHTALRHSRRGSPSTKDPDVGEYLFFLYFVTVRFALLHLSGGGGP